MFEKMLKIQNALLLEENWLVPILVPVLAGASPVAPITPFLGWFR